MQKLRYDVFYWKSFGLKKQIVEHLNSAVIGWKCTVYASPHLYLRKHTRLKSRNKNVPNNEGVRILGIFYNKEKT